MLQLFRLTLLCLALPCLLAAQQREPEFELPPDLGFLRVVNATGRPGKLWVTVNGVKLAAASGYEDGTATGAMAIMEKALSLEMRHDHLGELKQAVTLQAGVVTTLIARIEHKQAEVAGVGSPEKDKAVLAAHLWELPASRRAEESTLSLIQFTPAAQLPVSVKDTVCVLEPAKAQSIPIPAAMGAFLDVKIQGQIAAQLNFTDPAGQGVVFYTDTSGKLKSAFFRNDVH